MAHEGTSQVKQSRIELLMRKYELFKMSDKETVMHMYTRFIHITNELKSLEKSFTIKDVARKMSGLSCYLAPLATIKPMGKQRLPIRHSLPY